MTLELHGADPLAARLDEVLRAVLHDDVRALADGDDVSSAEPAVVGEARASFIRLALVVLTNYERPAHLELSHRLAVPGYESVLAPSADLDERHLYACRRAVGVITMRLVPPRRERGDGRRLRHAPTLKNLQTMTLGE